ncbi:peptidoglycan-recognition protein 2-like [Macrosteles quadrilineatus]|uniref:peptidoglycan-recognition protein 2-like n=1 Tax=Macrosteles quadrilineatus TaxID=74068 RepID=UPI0023E21D74|nr:peptidoglycan-recognition protein 2-like [Macrosteles quadrilineatus]
MEDYEGVQPNSYTKEDLEVLDKMTKIPHERSEYNDELTFSFCPRELWGAMDPDPRLPMRKVKFPASHVRFVDTGTDECYTPHDCFRLLQRLQKDHMEKENLPDIKYNFMVGADGTIYEGRGWTNDADRAPKYNRLQTKCIDIAFIGNKKDESRHVPDNPFPSKKSEMHGSAWAGYGIEIKQVAEDHEMMTSFVNVIRFPGI